MLNALVLHFVLIIYSVHWALKFKCKVFLSVFQFVCVSLSLPLKFLDFFASTSVLASYKTIKMKQLENTAPEICFKNQFCIKNPLVLVEVGFA